MAALFDDYIMVDWSAAARPTTGADSLWIAHVKRDGSQQTLASLKNPATRKELLDDLLDLLSDLVAQNRKTLLGFDFSFSYPHGFAGALGLAKENWLSIWAYLSRVIQDSDDNQNNRFDVASAINQKISASTGPFWGCPKTQQTPYLERFKPYQNMLLQEKRLCEDRLKGTKSPWQLYGAGSVGSQTLMGIPYLYTLKTHNWLNDHFKVFPFETGFSAENLDLITCVEIYPSQLSISKTDDLPKDALQVKTLAHHYADMDCHGTLAALFEQPTDLLENDIERIMKEEGWVLGVQQDEKAQARQWLQTYIKKPDDIYLKSQEMIEEIIDVSNVATEMQEVCVRMIHACGDSDIAADIDFSPNAARKGRVALEKGCAVFVDVEMVAHGIIKKRLPAKNQVICTLNDLQTPILAQELGTTRSAAGVELWGERLEGSVVVIGNAPTALFHLIEGILQGKFPKPALIIGCPVGFVGAMESKEVLRTLYDEHGVEYITLRGRRGGSAIAASALNAVAKKGIVQ